MRFLLEISGCRAGQWEFARIGRAVEFPVLGTLQLQHEDLTGVFSGKWKKQLANNRTMMNYDGDGDGVENTMFQWFGTRDPNLFFLHTSVWGSCYPVLCLVSLSSSSVLRKPMSI